VLTSLAIDLRQRAFRLVVAHQSIDAVNFVQGCGRDQRELLAIGSVDDYRVRASHGDPTVFEPVQLQVAGFLGMESRGNQDDEEHQVVEGEPQGEERVLEI